MSGILQTLFLGAAAAVKDAYFNLTTLLLNTSSTNGAQNNTFLDSSTNNFSITRNGNTTQGTFTPFSQTGWSNFFNSTANYLTVPYNSNFLWSTGARTYEAFVYVTSVTSNNAIFGLTNLSSSNTWELYINTSSQVVFRYFAGGVQTVTTTGTVPLNTWAHIAFVYDGTSSITIYINGVSAGTGSKVGTPVTDNNQLCIGRTDVGSAGNVTLSGYISNVRFTSAVVYTGAFTPSTTPLTAITNTSLLTSQSNRFVDNSASPATITSNGTPSVQAFSPFAPTAAYDTAVVGGSGYFDGSGDYLSLASSLTPLDCSTGDFTLECWVYVLPYQSGFFQYPIFSNVSGSYNSSSTVFTLDSMNTTPACTLIGPSQSAYVTVSLGNIFNQWTHLALTRSGNTFTIYKNGVSIATGTNAGAVNFNAGGTYIGRNGWDGYGFYGYINSLRLVKGTAVYTAAFTPPTAPLTAITNTSLLTNFTNAGIFDSTAKNDLETVGNAQVSTTQAKWGTTSMYFAGSPNYLQLSNPNANVQLGSGNFTIEMWVNFSSAAGTQVLNNYGYEGGSTNYSYLFYYSSNTIRFGNSTDGSAGTSQDNSLGAFTPTAGTWYHLALVRNGATVTCYVDGTALSAPYNISTRTIFFPGTASLFTLGGNLGNYFSGYIDDFRLTKGYARYTANFTAPTAAFPLQ
jgi:hypothetical protein